ncbi:MAG: lipoate--protein ligase family protein [Bacteriovoracaceae bacterium]|nr:lipoate--protein ligase family protein [Bacteriovoracaceae bacterium]
MELVTIDIPQTDPVKNLEYEEGILEKLEDNQVILRFWVNSPSMVMGRFQREEYEIANYARERGIPILRRFTGGGTVYHDLGNLNISIATCKSILATLSKESGSTVCTRLIADALNEMGFNVTHDEKRNALFHQGKKILGSAASIKGEKYLFHCSLLVDSDLEELERVIEKKPAYIEGGGAYVKSVRSRVTRLSDIIPGTTISDIKKGISKTISDKFGISHHRRIITDL